ncbi:lyso-ornithine lipid acyltransferase [Salinihabitans flavidus]|uniref:Lyso-ornithine lipid acyltransferase n=1 Tax=Salinihabitans flavidus TaxID=569882 RepID=A0A1H8VAG8_9RHOB|nr:lysophospholipid acyltransferase family protein [Salinihabitans flavidus]SEP12420.1 lyso-ornithine lipid acyltransferase [Salinihabitans flavidus]
MNPTWKGEGTYPDFPRITVAGWARVALRGFLALILILTGLVILLLLRMAERPFCGAGRPLSAYPVQVVSRLMLVLLGLRLRTQGAPMRQPGVLVANHCSWLDIFVLNTRKRVFFVSKSEVAEWPLIGGLARVVGTLFITRNPRDARVQTDQFRERLAVGHRLLFFPEGTSSDGQRVLRFKSTLFAAFFDPPLRDRMMVQPVSVAYRASAHHDPRFLCWWGDMEFAAHALQVLAHGGGASVTVVYHPPVAVIDFHDRKALAAYCEETVRAGLAQAVA